MSFQVDKLKYYVRNIVPTVYDDTLSYYELQNKVVEKLNEVVDNVNSYFDEDVDVHVGTILNEWYDSGKLQEIIDNNVLVEKVNRDEFDTKFESLDSDFNSIDDVLDTLTSSVVYVSQFGAVGDGEVDDTSAIQSAIDSVEGTAALIFDTGKTYKISAPINVDGSKIRLVSGNNAYLKLTGNFPGLHFRGTKTLVGTGPDHQQVHELKHSEFSSIIRDLQVYSVKDINGSYQGVGIVLEETHSPIVSNCHLFNLVHGLEVRGNTTRNITIDSCHMWDNRTSGIYFNDEGEVHQCVITNCFISYTEYNILIGTGHRMYNLHLSNSDLEAQVDQNVTHRSFLFSQGELNEVLLSNNTFQDHLSGTSESKQIDVDNFNVLIIDGCYFSHSNGNGIYLRNGRKAVITCNFFENIELDAIWLETVNEVNVNSNNFYDIRKRAIKLDSGTQRFTINGNHAYYVGYFLRGDFNVSVLGANISDNLTRPKYGAFRLFGTGNCRNFHLSNNAVYWHTAITPTVNEDMMADLEDYAFFILFEGALTLVNISNNTLTLRSTHISGFRISGAGSDGVIIKNNAIDEAQTSLGYTPFSLPSPAQTVDNLSVREG